MNDRIEFIQSSGFKAVFVIAGAGSGAVHELLSFPGASRFILDVRIPYSRNAMTELLGETPASFCSEDTVNKMCDAAFDMARQHSDERPLGIACTAALQTLVSRNDPDRAFIAFQTETKRVVYPIAFGPEDRRIQENKLSHELLEKLSLFLSEQ